MAKHRDTIAQLAQSGEVKRLMALLEESGGVQAAARAAAGGKPEQLMEMMNRLMDTKEGARLVDQIGKQARQSGLE
ncbi:MAG: hypothetical protein IKK44_01635 [Clostridium sp.]|nr:hypothetical protein [Clostridium sp.]